MPSYQYKIVTSNSESTGTIQAESEDRAKEALLEQHVPDSHNLVDGNGKPVEHKLVSLYLTELE